MAKTLKEIAMFVGGELSGSPDIVIKGINGIKEAGEGDLSFIVSTQYEDLVEASGASCVVIPKQVKRSFSKPTIKVVCRSLLTYKPSSVLRTSSALPHVLKTRTRCVAN